ncbi:hypothetical protein CC1G_08915 [Coprinopsis cinerea okayama7|uniref:DUF6534 domain-containing protein n=1 Tax=Coprinopsis cinerea (strain Okayama-7 / 130 / ATCC MYA-4618 / FGSC 9003) TaxID=240176 RepID=A8P8B2_COPC7|nr:hypothetical protein CC1G_08915 [Coprinopsis cinerea okayama7\|eukprot:XP_001839536.1 hypothetical protein CC1G_08915 [Coprinopsis cinerea okayama7\
MSDAPGLPSPTLLVGPILVGALASFLLFGAFVVQAFHYWSTLTPDDRKKLPIFVGFIAVIEIVNIAFIFDSAWHGLVESLIDPSAMTRPPATGPILQMLSGLVAASVQTFFAWRVSVLASNIWEKGVAALIALFAAAELMLAITVGAQFIMLNRDGSLIQKIGTTIGLQLGAALICDFLITISMVALLSRYKGRIAIAETKSVLNSITLNVIENGLITTVFASLNLAFFFARPGDQIHLAFHYVIGRLYANVLLASLNSRRRLHNSQRGATTHSTSHGGAIKLTARTLEQPHIISTDAKSGMLTSSSETQFTKPHTLGDLDLEERGEGPSPNSNMLVSISKEVFVEN